VGGGVTGVSDSAHPKKGQGPIFLPLVLVKQTKKREHTDPWKALVTDRQIEAKISKSQRQKNHKNKPGMEWSQEGGRKTLLGDVRPL